MKLEHVLLMIGVFLFVTTASFGGTVTAPWVQGTMINNTAPATNYGGRWDMHLVQDTGGQISAGLWEFDLSAVPSGSVVTNAVLYYTDYYQYSSSLPLYVDVKEALADWVEATATWNSFYANPSPQVGTTVLGTMEFEQVGNVAWESVTSSELSDVVQGWVDAPSTNHGVYIESRDIVGYWAQTTNNWMSPYIVVEYIPEPATLIMMAAGGTLAFFRRKKTL